MNKRILIIGLAAAILAGCNKTRQTEGGIKYRFAEENEDGRMPQKGDMLMLDLLGKTESNDSVLFDSYKNRKPYYIPLEEPTLQSVFSLMHEGDSAEFWVNADTLFLKSFGQPRPAAIKEGEMIHFIATLHEVYNQQELQAKTEEQQRELISLDSMQLDSFLKANPGFSTTGSGLKYNVVKATKGKKVKKGDRVTVNYKGSLLNGSVFDQSKPDQPPFSFNVGLGQVIPGWDEGLQMMNEGEQYRLVIPWQLAYGERGSGPIPPYSTLVFDVELISRETGKAADQEPAAMPEKPGSKNKNK